MGALKPVWYQTVLSGFETVTLHLAATWKTSVRDDQEDLELGLGAFLFCLVFLPQRGLLALGCDVRFSGCPSSLSFSKRGH
jgi:hypothetical protein